MLQMMVPASMFVLMTIIGMELTRTDFRRVLDDPKTILLCSLAQWIGLPLLALLLIALFQPGSAATIGLLVLAACPGGGLSNVLTLYARGNIALSVTLTAVACLASLAGLPIVIAFALWWTAAETAGSGVPMLPILGQLLFLVLVPVLLGMQLRARFSIWVVRHYRNLQRANLLLLLVVVVVGAGLNLDGSDLMITPQDFIDALPIAAAYAAGSAVIALASARLMRLGRPETITLLIEFLQRNAGVMVLILVVIMQRPDLIAAPFACFTLQMALLTVLMVGLRRLPAPASGPAHAGSAGAASSSPPASPRD